MTVLEHQYKKFKYFDIDHTAKLAEKNKCARSHNIDAVEIMGMCSALKKKSRNATMFPNKKRSVDEYWDTMEAVKQKMVIRFAITNGCKERAMEIQKQSLIRREISKRIVAKRRRNNRKNGNSSRDG